MLLLKYFKITGDLENPGRWIYTWSEGGTTRGQFYHFIERITHSIGAGTNENVFAFDMGNLRSHTNIEVQVLMIVSG